MWAGECRQSGVWFEQFRGGIALAGIDRGIVLTILIKSRMDNPEATLWVSAEEFSRSSRCKLRPLSHFPR